MSVSESKIDVNLRYRARNYGVLLAKDINYSQLVEHVNEKFRVGDDDASRLTFLLSRKVFDVSDDDGVQHFVHQVIKGKVNTLTITTTKESCEVSSSKPLDLDHTKLVSGSDKNVNFVHPNSEKECLNTGYNYAWKLTNMFEHMPSPPSTPSPVSKTCRSLWGRECAGRFRVGEEFADKDEYIFQLGKKALIEGFEYIASKSCRLRYEAHCARAGCKWSIFASKLPCCDMFLIKRANDIHTCSKTQINPYHRNATVKLLCRLLAPRISDWTRVYKPKDIINDFKIDYKATISYRQAWLAQDRASKIVMGCPMKSFHELPFYCYNLKLKNEGTVTDIRSDDNGRFEMLYVGFGVTIRSFLNSMRPLLIIDASHLKGEYLGTNLVAAGMDGNNQIVPIDIGVCQNETKETWSWFLSNLKKSIDEVPDLAIISDRHQAIVSACKTVFPNAFHGFCCRHLMMNCSNKTSQFRAVFWKTCKQGRSQDFQLREADSA